jgi:hypothetical protein
LAATVEIDEQNGASGAPTLSHNITNTNMGSTDAINLDPVAFPVIPGQNTYEKWQKLHVTAMGGSSSVQNLKIWRTGALGGAATHLTNARIASYGGAASYTTPVASASSTATQTMPTAAPASANLGIAASLAGTLTATGSSDFLCHQIQTNAADTVGTTTTMNYQYDEVA